MADAYPRDLINVCLKEAVNGESIIDFLNKIRMSYQTCGTIHLVLNGAGYHRNRLVIEEAEN